MHFPVFLERSLVRKCLPTVVAHVRLLSSMCSQVYLQIRHLREHLAALRTAVRLHRQMDLLVDRKCTGQPKRLIAHVAFVLLLLRMQMFMLTQAARPRKRSIAFRTRVWPLAGMLVAVVFQIRRRNELPSTDAADVWLFARMERPHVTDETVWLDELSVTVLAAVGFVRAVDVRVALEPVSGRELHAAIGAHERFFARVTHHVIPQLIEILVVLAADRAWKALAARPRRPTPTRAFRVGHRAATTCCCGRRFVRHGRP